MSNHKVLAVIPARGGSKGLLRKNIRRINGRPLIAWTIERALQSELLDAVVVSTDDPEIAQVAGDCGLPVPFLRPTHLATDDSPSADAILHVLDELETRGRHFDLVVLLEPTSPLRSETDIDDAVQLLMSHDEATSVISVGAVHTEHPMIVKKLQASFLVPYVEGLPQIYQRQMADEAYFPYGVIYVSRVPVFREIRSFYSDGALPYFIKRWQNYEVDDEIDFILIELLIKCFMGGDRG